MAYQVKVEQFEGPLDLLLQLIEQNKLDITKLSLSKITDEYIHILHDASKDISLDELADFLVVAAKLLLIKSKALMPYLSWDEEDEDGDLEKQLKMYEEYLEAAKAIQKIISKKRFLYFREKFLAAKEVGFHPPQGITGNKMAMMFQGIINGLVPILNFPKSVIKRTINIQEKISRIRSLITERANIHFSKILKEAKNKTEVIVSFLAILELMKQREVVVSQENVFEEIVIERI